MEKQYYTVKQLAAYFDCSEQTIHNWIVQDVFGAEDQDWHWQGKSKIVLITASELEKIYNQKKGIFIQINQNNQNLAKHNKVEQVDLLDQDNFSQNNQVDQIKSTAKTQDKSLKYEDVVTNLFNLNQQVLANQDKLINFTQDTQSEIKEYLERIIQAESKVKLIEDSENRKDREIIELRAKVAQLEAEIEQLKRKWWNFGKK